MAKLREKLKTHKELLPALAAALVVLCAAVLIWLACVRPELGKGYTERLYDDYSAATALPDGATATQVFTYDDALLAVALEFELPSGPAAGDLELCVRDADTGEELACSTGVMSYLVPGQYTVLGLDREIPATAGRRYALEVTPHYTGAGEVALGHSAGVALWSEPMLVDGAAVDGTLALLVTAKRIGGYLTRFFLLVSAGAAALVFVGVYGALCQKIKLYRLVFVLVVGFGLLYSLVLPPYAAPDEKYHINQSFTLACQWANRLSPEDWEMGHVPTTTSFRRVSDVDTILQDENTTVFLWKQFTDHLTDTTPEPFYSHVELNELQTDQNPLLYLASGAAVFLGYLLHLGFTPTLALGRLANLLVFALLAAFAVKRAACGRRVFVAAALLPMTLHLAASFSRDAVLLGLAFAFTALVTEAFSAASTGRLPLRTLLPLVCLGVLLAPGKMVYLPLAALFLALPAAALGKRPLLQKGCYLAACVALALVLNLGTLASFLPGADPTENAATAAEAADADLPAAKNRPAQPNPEYETFLLGTNTPETFVRRLYYYVEDNDAPADSEVQFWCKAMADGDVTPLVLAQSFFFSPAKVEAGYTDAEAFCSEVSLVFVATDMIEQGNLQFLPLFEEQGAETVFKALFSDEHFQAYLADASGLALGTVMDDRVPLDRTVLAAEVEAARATRATQSVTDEADAATYTPGYILRHLPATVLLVVRSAVQNGDHLLQTLVGGSLSYYTLDLAWGWVLVLYLLLAYAALPVQGAAALCGRARVWGGAAALGCGLLALGGCILWTPTHYATIYGFQGRYLLPVLPLFMLTCLPRRGAAVPVLQDEDEAAAHLLCLLCLVQAGILLNIMLAVIAR